MAQRSVLAVVATPRSRSTADGRGAGHRLRPLQPTRQGFLTGKIDQRTTFDSADIRTTIPRLTPEARNANQALVELLGRIAERKQATPAQVASPGYSPRSPGSCRSPAPAGWTAMASLMLASRLDRKLTNREPGRGRRARQGPRRSRAQRAGTHDIDVSLPHDLAFLLFRTPRR